MKKIIKKLVKRMVNWPVFGPLIQIAVSIVRLPELHRRQHMFETEQLPALLQTISELNHRQLGNDGNFVKSVPPALRAFKRELVEIREKKGLSDANVKLTQSQFETIFEKKINKIKNQLDNVSLSLNEQIVESKKENSVTEYLLGRVEFVRRELMFEMHFGSAPAFKEKESLNAQAKIISKEKLALARKSRLRLNLGCGHLHLNDYINVDRRELPKVDVVAEVGELPFTKNEVDEIFSAHLLEHFPQEQLRRELLPYFFSLLKERGEFHAIVPDAKAMIKKYSNDDYPYVDMREVFYGAQDYEGDFHFNMFTPESLSTLLLEAGFIDINIVDEGRKNGICYEFEIIARRPQKND